MTNKNLPIEVKENNIFKKIFAFIKNIFKKSNKQNLINEEVKVSGDYEVKKPLFESERTIFNTSSEKNKKQVLEEIISIIEKNPEMLEKLEVEKLEVIDMYYKNKVEEYRAKLNEYKHKLNKKMAKN